MKLPFPCRRALGPGLLGDVFSFGQANAMLPSLHAGRRGWLASNALANGQHATDVATASTSTGIIVFVQLDFHEGRCKFAWPVFAAELSRVWNLAKRQPGLVSLAAPAAARSSTSGRRTPRATGPPRGRRRGLPLTPWPAHLPHARRPAHRLPTPPRGCSAGRLAQGRVLGDLRRDEAVRTE